MTNMELYHYGIKGMRWGHRKARPTMSGAARSARRKRIAKRVALGVGAAAGAAALGYGAYRGKKYISTPHGAAHLMVGALRAQQGIDRAKGAARSAAGTVGGYALGGKRSARRAKLRSAAENASILGNSARLAGGIAAKRAGNAVRGAGSSIKDRSSDIRQKLRQGRAAAETVADVYRTRRKYQGRHVSRGAHAAHFAYDSPGEALYHFALDPYGRYAIL